MTISTFGQYALKLNDHFEELENLSGQLERLSIETDSGLEKAKQLLVRFSETGMQVAEGVQGLAKSLDEARGRAERAAQFVSGRALEIQARQQECDQLGGRFKQLAEKVRDLSSTVGQLKKPEGENVSAEDRNQMTARLPELDSGLGALAEEANILRQDARAANMKALERDADSLGQSLGSARRKLGAFGGAQPNLH